MTELQFSTALRKVLREEGWLVANLQRCDSEPSIPDLYLHHIECGLSLFVELKVLRGGRVSFRDGQVRWHTRWTIGPASSRVEVITLAEDSIWITDGRHSSLLSSARGLGPGSLPDIASLDILPASRGWPRRVARCLACRAALRPPGRAPR